MAAHGLSHRWPKSLLAEVGFAALKSRRPYEVFKLAHSYFVRSARLPDHDSLVSEAGQAAWLSLFLKSRERSPYLASS